MTKEHGIYGQSIEVDNGYDSIETYDEEEIVKFKPAKFTECIRCKQQKPVIGMCPTCPQHDLKTCTCGHLAKWHSFAIGYRSKREIDVCGSCIGAPEDNKSVPGYICQLFVEAK